MIWGKTKLKSRQSFNKPAHRSVGRTQGVNEVRYVHSGYKPTSVGSRNRSINLEYNFAECAVT